ncbi:MAG: AmmeMemoRadiSam system protein B [Candidatus Aminicenantales bacterium]
MEEQIPRLRKDIEIIPTFYEGKRALLVRDSLGLIKEPFLLHGEILSFLSLIDGKRTIRDIQADLVRIRNGVFISSEEVAKILGQLDSLFLLESDRYHREKEEITSSYSHLPTRVAYHAGRSYPQQKEELRMFLQSFFDMKGDTSLPFEDKEIGVLVAPHVDLKAGMRVYARAYQAIKELCPSRVLLLGTGHSLHESLFCLTEKDFETPLGTVETDKVWVRRLRDAGEGIITTHDIAHRSEHSLEFQILFLQHLFGSDFSLIPILCGSFQGYLQEYRRPREIPGMGRFLAEFQNCVEDSDSTLVVVGVDLSHVGLKFGHDRRAVFLKMEAKGHDKALLDALCEGNVVKFWGEARRVNNRYNVCGLSCLATLLEIHPEKRGYLLDYEFWQEESTQSAVGFAAVVIER